MDGESDNYFSDVEWDKPYFDFVFQLEEKNQSRYESQARDLLSKKVLTTEVDGALVRYKLEFLGCRCEISRDSGRSFQHASWIRTGWRKSEKLESLPLLFATTEAEILYKG